MKQRTKHVGITILGVCLISLLLILSLFVVKRFFLPEITFDGRTIFYEGRQYTVHPDLELDRSKAGEAVGDSGLVIQSIQGYPQEQWLTICHGHGPACTVYIEKSVGTIDLNRFSPSEMAVKETLSEKKPATIRDPKLISQLVEVMTKAPPTKFPKDYKVKKTIQIQLKSTRFKHLTYVLLYLEDQAGHRYLRGEKLVEIRDTPEWIKKISS
ncbi:hypothetical protein [Lihuaxuella thermophila]|uniref:Uncharacterized protein n=1 Tax=Lihuaxuella thermophila TaxID=1173111 RepID=A0A1H8C7Q4_9BACL|nr:hypothetical protein [Lihuaxuella thermophila]SEM91070.1 hypothetical protein SAMN05444955_103124 [Lihuaxuella thermophila]